MNITAVLLAGGESRRMGQDKATISFGDEPLWQRQVGLLRQIEPAEVLISVRTDVSWRPADCRLVLDEPPSRGPLSGVAASLKQTGTPHLLVLAIDMPFMTTSFLSSLRGTVQPGRGVVALIENQPEPLAAIYPVESQVDAANALASSDFSMRSFVAKLIQSGRLDPFQVPESDRPLFRNLNVPSDIR